MKNSISQFLQERIDARDFPSAVYLVAEKSEVILQDALGFAVVEPEKIEARIDTIYDLASLTKVLVTGLLCAKLIENGEINLSDKISKYFDEFNTDDKREITIENLLTHTSGFQSWKPFYLLTEKLTETSYLFEQEKVLELIAQNSLKSKTNIEVTYSDLNFILLGFLVDRLCGGFLEEILEREIINPLNLQNTFFNPPKKLQKDVAASEYGNEFEKNTCVESGYDISKYDWRKYQIWGEVHDGNCYFMNGVSGHAGLFSNAYETLKIAQQFIADQTTILKPETCKLFRTNFTPNLNEARSIGFQLAETPESTASLALSKDSFGHLGFTGTSLWIDPAKARIFILLTNRTHARELPFININSTRRRFHELAVEILDKTKI